MCFLLKEMKPVPETKQEMEDSPPPEFSLPATISVLVGLWPADVPVQSFFSSAGWVSRPPLLYIQPMLRN